MAAGTIFGEDIEEVSEDLDSQKDTKVCACMCVSISPCKCGI